MAADNETFTLESIVRGHHVYKRIWSPRTGQVLEASAETGNPEDRHVVALQQERASYWGICLEKFQRFRGSS